MKTRFFTVIACLLFSLHLFGQLQKGDISLQGNLGLGYQWSAGPADGISLPINPSIAWMLSDHWLVGAAFGSNVYADDNLDSDHLLPFARYYFNPSSSGNNYFLGTGVNLFFSDETQLGATFTAGFNRFIAPNLSLETTVGYSIDDTNLGNVINAGVGFRSFLSKDSWRNRKEATSNLAQGTWLLGTSDLSLVLNGDFISTRLSPNFGYFLTNRFVLGLNSELSYRGPLGNELNDFKNTRWSTQPFVRYYFPNQGQRLVPFGQFGLGYAFEKTESENRYEIMYNRFSTHARLGANLFLAPNVAFEFSLDLRRSFDSNAEVNYNRDVFSEELFPNIDDRLNDKELELSLNMGVQFFLFRK